VKLLELGNILKPGSVYHANSVRPLAQPEPELLPDLSKIRERITATGEP